MKEKRRYSKVFAFATAAYVPVMVYLMFFRGRDGFSGSYTDYIKGHIKPIPFDTIAYYVRRLTWGAGYTRAAVSNLFGNVVLFIPLGVILPYYIGFARRWYKTALTAAAVMLAVETAQLFTARGTFDVDDIILNTLGAIIGYAVFAYARRGTEILRL